MEVFKQFFWVSVIFLGLSTLNQLNSEERSTYTIIKYTLTTRILNASSLSDKNIKVLIRKFRRGHAQRAMTRYLYTLRRKQKPGLPKIVNNLYSTLKHFTQENCLIVMNNFEGIDVYPEISFPIILRKFDLAILEFEYVDPFDNSRESVIDVLWLPKNRLSKLNGNFFTQIPNNISWYELRDNLRHPCSTSSYFGSIFPSWMNSAYCLELNVNSFSAASKPWQCKLQVDLFLPDDLLQLGKYTQIFSQRTENLPSLRPPVHILIDTKTYKHKYDLILLAAWSLKRNERFNSDNYIPSIVNDVQINGHVSCEANLKKIFVARQCNISTLNLIYPCPECQNFLTITPLNLHSFSFHTIRVLERSQMFVAFPLEFDSDAQFNLGGQIVYFARKETKAITLPLKHISKLSIRYSDKIQLLGFGYASVLISLMGNSTANRAKINPGNQFYYYFLSLMKRSIYIEEEENLISNTLKFENVFGRLHFVSCGSRGVEAFPFSQFLSVFEWKVWLSVVMCISLLSAGIIQLTKGACKYVSVTSSILSIVKLFLEQGNPFPANFDKLQQLRFLMSGVLLGGLVISNAFKSENVYNIVLPRGQMSYHYIDELVNDNFTVYSRISRFDYGFQRGPKWKSALLNHIALLSTEKISLQALTELYYGGGSLIKAKVQNLSRMHPKVFNILSQQLNYFDHLMNVGRLDNTMPNEVFRGYGFREEFLEKQQDIITNDINKCSKSAWVMPKYLAERTRKSLKLSGKHSDVSVLAYSKPQIAVWYKMSYVPSSLLQRISLIQTSGLIEWWPKFLNSSATSNDKENTPPAKPNMSGNILVIFVFLGGGITVSFVCMGIEVCMLTLSYIIILYITISYFHLKTHE